MVLPLHWLASKALTTLQALLSHKLSISTLALTRFTGCAPDSLPPSATATCRSLLATSAATSSEDRFLRSVFDMLDADMDGRVSIHDVALHLAKLGIAPSCEALTEVVQSAGVQGSFLTYKDFVRLYEEGEEELAEAFAMYDVDGDGFISLEELQEVLVRMGFTECRDHHFCHLIVQSIDANSDGKIDYFEFRQMMSPKF